MKSFTFVGVHSGRRSLVRHLDTPIPVQGKDRYRGVVDKRGTVFDTRFNE